MVFGSMIMDNDIIGQHFLAPKEVQNCINNDLVGPEQIDIKCIKQ